METSRIPHACEDAHRASKLAGGRENASREIRFLRPTVAGSSKNEQDRRNFVATFLAPKAVAGKHVAGRPLLSAYSPEERAEEILRRIAVRSRLNGQGCLVWSGHSRNGYGRIRGLSGRVEFAHRASYEATFGPVPAGLVLDHLCRNPACVNPSHLEAVTAKENTLRGFGACAKNARKTHCRAGHPLSGQNLRIEKGNRRRCVRCLQERDKKRSEAKYRSRRKGAA